ncbi:MAG: sigma-70 family RNA polymerase sigma factor [Isosphaeraceae bacterium]|nr:sigma-70 family RNA polymerase sigma factor [Isosphaeraceae bacterium]
MDDFDSVIASATQAMVRVARRILGDEVQAWDAVQEALISFWEQAEVPANPRSWLIRAVVLRSLHQARSRSRRRRHERRCCEERPEASERESASRRLEFDETERSLEAAFRSLPEEYRDVVRLRAGANMDYAAIAEALDIPIGTVRSRLNRTRRIFRDLLARDQLFPSDSDRLGESSN